MNFCGLNLETWDSLYFIHQLAKIGIIICYDRWFPETYRILAAQGADIVCVPTNWVTIDSLPE